MTEIEKKAQELQSKMEAAEAKAENAVKEAAAAKAKAEETETKLAKAEEALEERKKEAENLDKTIQEQQKAIEDLGKKLKEKGEKSFDVVLREFMDEHKEEMETFVKSKTYGGLSFKLATANITTSSPSRPIVPVVMATTIPLPWTIYLLPVFVMAIKSMALPSR